ncbi:hypothetical protein [Solidesulfovibrio sp.]
MRSNKTLKTLCMAAALTLAAALVMAALPVRAAEIPAALDTPPEVLVDGFLKGLTTRVQLTPPELAAVRPILIEQTRKRQDMARSRLAATPGLPGMKALRDDLRHIGQETDARLAAILPPDKLAAIQAFREETRRAAKGRRKAAG